MLFKNTGILKINEAIYKAIQKKMLPVSDGGSETKIRFDIPPEGKVAHPTVSVFLYDIHEDLQLRHGLARHYDPGTGKITPERVNLQCCYLITSWQKGEDKSDAQASKHDSEQMKLNDNVLAALLSSRTLKEVPGAFCRVLPPNEHLNSLGSFWQALGNKPRLSLSFMVTFPVDVFEDDAEQSVMPLVLAPENDSKSVLFSQQVLPKIMFDVANQTVDLLVGADGVKPRPDGSAAEDSSSKTSRDAHNLRVLTEVVGLISGQDSRVDGISYKDERFSLVLSEVFNLRLKHDEAVALSQKIVAAAAVFDELPNGNEAYRKAFKERKEHVLSLSAMLEKVGK